MKTLLLCFLVVFTASNISAQDNEGDDGVDTRNVRPAKINPLKGAPLRDRLYVGGDLNFNYGRNFLFFGFSPFVGYKITEDFSFGAGPKYQIYNYNDPSFSYKDDAYGGSIFTRYLIGEWGIVQAEAEIFNATNNSVFIQGDRATVGTLLGCIGYRQGSEQGYYQVLLCYDLVDDSNSPNRYMYMAGIPLFIRGGLLINL